MVAGTVAKLYALGVLTKIRTRIGCGCWNRTVAKLYALGVLT